MLQELRWRTSVSATCLHAAACRAAGLAGADAQLAAAIDVPSDRIAQEISAAGWRLAETLDQLTALAAEIDNNRELVIRAAARLRQAEVDQPTLVRLAGAVSDLEAALSRAQPALAEELPLRIRPMREQWEALGPGMLLEIGRLTEGAVIPAAAEIVIVAPYAGGHGAAHVQYNRVTLEGVLVNPIPELPETVRMAWLLAQLNADLPRFSDVIPRGRSAAVFRLALLPPALAAAEAVEQGQCNEAALEHALTAWRLYDANAAPGVATHLWNWWNAWLDHAQSWPVAVAALEQLLSAKRPREAN